LDSKSEVKWAEVKKEFGLSDAELGKLKKRHDDHYGPV
jgi:hypothetical protein